MYKIISPSPDYSQDLDTLGSLGRQHMELCSATNVLFILPAVTWALRPTRFCPAIRSIKEVCWTNCRSTMTVHTRQQSQMDRAQAPA